MQAFLTTPIYNKFYIYKIPTNQHQRFCNAFGYYRMVNMYTQKLVYVQNVLMRGKKFGINLRKKSKVKSRNIWQLRFQFKAFYILIIHDLAHLKAQSPPRPRSFKNQQKRLLQLMLIHLQMLHRKQPQKLLMQPTRNLQNFNEFTILLMFQKFGII